MKWLVCVSLFLNFLMVFALFTQTKQNRRDFRLLMVCETRHGECLHKTFEYGKILKEALDTYEQLCHGLGLTRKEG